jgi:serine/threonine-protein kinase
LSGRYEVVREIGSGGIATVYLCHDLRHGHDVAVKVVRSEIMSTVVRERFAREIGIAARLNHPHILTLHDSGDADGVLFYVMPFISGESLRTRLDREGRLTVDEALRITRQIASALDHAHAENIVHRDALVADFGIALALGAGRRLTTVGFSIGTPE